MDVTPDVLVLPSDLNPFAKVVPRVPEPAASATAPAMPARAAEPKPSAAADAFVAMNPGRVAKGNAGGAFALVRIAEHAPVGPGEHVHAVGERARVDIVRV